MEYKVQIRLLDWAIMLVWIVREADALNYSSLKSRMIFWNQSTKETLTGVLKNNKNWQYN